MRTQVKACKIVDLRSATRSMNIYTGNLTTVGEDIKIGK